MELSAGSNEKISVKESSLIIAYVEVDEDIDVALAIQ
jgi:hypothetical protein